MNFNGINICNAVNLNVFKDAEKNYMKHIKLNKF